MSDKLTHAVLLALDWGTSSLRAFLVAADGGVLAERHRPWGIATLPDGGYPAAFLGITEDWPVANLPVIASGMVGSRAGWKEVPYLPLPCDPSALAGALEQVAGHLPGGDGEIVLHLVPGLIDPAGPDVMRGEETEAIGALERLDHPAGSLTLVLPGTHSKWLRIQDGALTGFSTIMTGEVFNLLATRSILAAPAEPLPAQETETAFAAAVCEAADTGLSRALFRTRARMLTGELAAGLVTEHLSGLLIGEEIAAMTRGRSGDRIVLVGDAALTERYARAFAALDRPTPERLQAAAVRGLTRIARHAGLIAADPGAPIPC